MSTRLTIRMLPFTSDTYVTDEATGIQHTVPIGSLEEFIVANVSRVASIHDPRVSITTGTLLIPISMIQVVIMPEPSAPPLPPANDKKRDNCETEADITTVCPICLEDGRGTGTWMDFGCGNRGHRGHRGCFMRWIDNHGVVGACPLCRGDADIFSRNVRARSGV